MKTSVLKPSTMPMMHGIAKGAKSPCSQTQQNRLLVCDRIACAKVMYFPQMDPIFGATSQLGSAVSACREGGRASYYCLVGKESFVGYKPCLLRKILKKNKFAPLLAVSSVVVHTTVMYHA